MNANFVQPANVVMRSSIGSSENFITSISGTPLMATDSAITTSVSDTASAADGSYKTAFVEFGDGAVSRSVIVRLNSEATTRITAMDSNGYNVEDGYINLSLDTSNYTYTGQYVLTSTAAVSAGVFVGYQGVSASAICGYTVPLAHASALPTYSYDAEDKISAINGSAIAGGGGGVDSATVSAIASSYAESAVSSYQPLSGMSGYASAFSAGEGLEFVQSGSDQVLQVEAPVDIVAGPGIVIDNPDGNTLRVSVAADYETVLWSGSANSGTFSENISAFEKVRFHMRDDTRIVGIGTLYVDDVFASGCYVISCGSTTWDYSQQIPVRVLSVSGNYTGFTTDNTCYQWWAPNDGGFASFPVTKVVGIHRIANN